MARVDVIVPCYNYGDLLDACVASVLSQQEVDTRVLIMDDASTDETPEVGRRLAARMLWGNTVSSPALTHRRVCTSCTVPPRITPIAACARAVRPRHCGGISPDGLRVARR
jgi:cellulose synthase/poly-beta-1,6-N-acetylglucosamine synthase-like glycosyltransferase